MNQKSKVLLAILLFFVLAVVFGAVLAAFGLTDVFPNAVLSGLAGGFISRAIYDLFLK